MCKHAIYVKITKKANRLHSMHVCLLSIAPANVPLSIDRRTRRHAGFRSRAQNLISEVLLKHTSTVQKVLVEVVVAHTQK